MNIHSRLIARLKGTCYISTTAGGPVTGTDGPLSVQPGGEVTQASQQSTVVSGPTDIVKDPGAPQPDAPEGETPEAKVARETEATRRAALTEEERLIEDAKAQDKPADDANKEKTPEELNAAWESRDKAKDVPLAAEQEAQIAKMTHLTPEQQTAVKDFTVEMNTTNNLSPASRAKAAEVWGVDPVMVDNYVAGIQAQNERTAAANKPAPAADDGKLTAAQQEQFDAGMNALYAEAGSKDNWRAFAAWATGGGLTEDQQIELANAIDVSPNIGALAAQSHIQAWKAKGNGGAPLDLSRGAGLNAEQPIQGPKGFASQAAQQVALNARDEMGRMKMDSDPAYRSSVEQRMAVSDFSKSGLEKSFMQGAMMVPGR